MKVHTAAVGCVGGGVGGTLNLYIIDVAVRDCQRHAGGGVWGWVGELSGRGNKKEGKARERPRRFHIVVFNPVAFPLHVSDLRAACSLVPLSRCTQHTQVQV